MATKTPAREPDDAPEYPLPPADPPPADAEQGTVPEPLSAGQFDQQGQTWSDDYTAATDNPAHPLRHLKGVV